MKAIDQNRKKHVAWKRMIKNGTKMSREVEILSLLKGCSHVVQLENFRKKVIQNIILEFGQMDMETLLEQWRDQERYGDIQGIKKLFKEVMKGVLQLHERDIIHRDLKPYFP